MDKKIEDLEKKVAVLEEKCKTIDNLPKSKEKKQSTPRKPTAFNIYMKKKIKELKTANPELKHSDAFKDAAKLWSEEKET